MEAIILEFKEKTIRIKNIDTEKVSYLHGSKEGLKKGDVISVDIENSHFHDGFLFISGEVELLSDGEYIFDECLKCGDSFNDPSLPLCKKCWKDLQKEKKSEPKSEEKKRTFRKDPSVKESNTIYQDFRKKYPADYRALDGHWVRSRAEKMIDDCLYRNKIIHEYEKRIPGEYMLSDFYIPKHKIWIEYWGKDNEEYNIRREDKIELYKKRGYYDRLIELTEDEIGSVDDVLEEKLMKLGVPLELV